MTFRLNIRQQNEFIEEFVNTVREQAYECEINFECNTNHRTLHMFLVGQYLFEMTFCQTNFFLREQESLRINDRLAFRRKILGKEIIVQISQPNELNIIELSAQVAAIDFFIFLFNARRKMSRTKTMATVDWVKEGF